MINNNHNKLTLKEARILYREEHKKCRYCEFSEERISTKEFGGGIISKDTITWCLVKDEKCKEVCDFYQVKGE